ncbi:hypothetical protein N8864_04035 [Gammaproteobacteria bacterium]|nr:hypothetical protein [Gammaproteobacteria bacterium]
MEKILVSGDSFTDPNYKSHHTKNYKHKFTWPDKLDGQVTNVAVSGQCNPGMIARALDQIYHDKPDRVIIALSCWSRFTASVHRINPLFLFHNANNAYKHWDFSELDKQEYEKQLKHMSGMMKFSDKTTTPEECIRGFLQYNIPYFVWKTSLDLNTLALVCEHQGIKLHVFQMLHPFGVPNKYQYIYNEFSNQLIACDLFMDLYERKVDLIGYPWIKNAGGVFIDDMLSRDEGKHRVGDGDAHPNEQGHRLIGDWFNANYKDYEI